MTGKEALKQYKRIYVDKTFKGEFCPTQEWFLEIIDEELENKEKLEKNYDKLKKELNKYKRAFEILYDKLQLGVKDATKNGAPSLFLLLSIGCDQLLDVDEYDLLEELM